MLGDRGVERVVNERGFPGDGDAGDSGQKPDRNRNVEVLQIVAGGALNNELLVRDVRGARGRNLDTPRATQERASDGPGVGRDLGGRALGHHLTAVDASTGADIE